MTIHRITTTAETAIPDGKYFASSVPAENGVTTTLVSIPPIVPPKFDTATVTFNGVCMVCTFLLGVLGFAAGGILSGVFGAAFFFVALAFAMRIGAAGLAKKLLDERDEAVAKAAVDSQAATFMAGPPR